LNETILDDESFTEEYGKFLPELRSALKEIQKCQKLIGRESFSIKFFL
jgi:hypothetical protein